MGCFDTVWLHCPKCGHRNSYQSKAGSCSLDDYLLAEAPIEIQADLHGLDLECEGCGSPLRVMVQAIATVILGPGPEMKNTWDCRCGETGIDFEEHPNVCPACGKDVRTDWKGSGSDLVDELLKPDMVSARTLAQKAVIDDPDGFDAQVAQTVGRGGERRGGS